METLKTLKYTFRYIEHCNMCGASTSTQKVLGKRMNTSQGKKPKKKTGISTTIAKCRHCGLIYANPQPIPFNIQDHYGVPPENYWKEDYFTVSEIYFQNEINCLKTLMLVSPGLKSLDIGAGLGKAMIAMQKAGFDAYGFEPSKQFHERAVSKMGIDPQKLKLGQIEEMQYPENSFGFISFGAVLEHLYDPSGSIQKAMHWLKPGGIVHIEVPSADWLINKIINLVYRIKRTDYVGNLSPMHEPYHLYEFTLKSFQEHAAKHGYELALYQYHVCETYMPKAADLFLKPYMKRTKKGMQLCVWLRKN